MKDKIIQLARLADLPKDAFQAVADVSEDAALAQIAKRHPPEKIECIYRFGNNYYPQLKGAKHEETR